jgi:hypothetical protein
VLGFFVWRAIGGRWRRDAVKREVRFAGEDAELLQLPPDELRERAQRLAANGDYAAALRHLYIALLLTLDTRGVWRYDTRRTNWEHIHALRKKPTAAPLITPLSTLTRHFDRVRYGNAPCTENDWTRFRQRCRCSANIARAGTILECFRCRPRFPEHVR